MRSDEAEVRLALEHAELSGASADRLRKALHAVLLFHSPPPWTPVKRDAWYVLTGQLDCTSKVLCDVARAALIEEGQ